MSGGMAMRLWRQLLTGFVFASVVTLLLSLLLFFEVSVNSHRKEMTVFHPEPVTRIGQSNLVDVFIALPLKHRIKAVDWNGEVLSVDLAVGNGSRAADVQSDLLELLRLAFIQTDNTGRLLVRFVEWHPYVRDGGAVKSNLLMSADVRKSDDGLRRFLPIIQSGDLYEKQWRDRLRINYTASWFERYGAVLD
ncbi:hypothetical protein AB6A23_15260 [Paenibacillus tarimensis]